MLRSSFTKEKKKPFVGFFSVIQSLSKIFRGTLIRHEYILDYKYSVTFVFCNSIRNIQGPFGEQLKKSFQQA